MVETARKALADLEDVLLDYMEVVEQPLARRADIGSPVGSNGQLGIDLFQDPPRLIQPVKQREMTPLPARFSQPLGCGNRAGTFGQVLGAE
jgi:hypothetical protein